jgi:hypothetical protein
MGKKVKQIQEAQREQRITNPMSQRLFTLKEAAKYLGRGVWGVRELVWGRKIPVVISEGGRKWFFDIVDLDEFIQKNKFYYA